jgi:hypothetical protein
LVLDVVPVTLLLALIAAPPPSRPRVLKPVSLTFAPDERTMMVNTGYGQDEARV